MTGDPNAPQEPAAAPQPEGLTPGDSAQAPAMPDTPAAPVAPSARPRPAYGELAPEGWEWKPETAADSAGTTGGASAQAGSGTAAPAASPTLPGVPHNLGAGLPKRGGAKSAPGAYSPKGSGSGTPGASSTGTQQPSAPGAPYRADAPAAAAAPRTNPQQPGAPKPRVVDRVFTIGLLVLGGLVTLSMVSSLFALESQIRLTATMIGLEHATLASWVGPLGTIGGIVVLALFAVTLIFSIQRMRAGKLAFWVPLTAGVIAVLIMAILPAVAMLAGAPEIMQQLEADPNGSIDKMLEYMRTMQP